MSDERTPMDCKAATQDELCAGALQHYDDLSTKACSWMNSIPQAIRFWFLERPQLERELAEANKRVDAWVREARALARELGLEDDASNGSIADWRFIKTKLSQERAARVAAEADARRYRWLRERLMVRLRPSNNVAELVWLVPAVQWLGSNNKEALDTAIKAAREER